MGLLRRGHQPLQALHLGLELALVVGQLTALLVRLGQGPLRLHHLGGLSLESLHLGLEMALVACQLLLQPAGFVERPPGRHRLLLRLFHLGSKAAGIGNKPVIVKAGLK